MGFKTKFAVLCVLALITFISYTNRMFVIGNATAIWSSAGRHVQDEFGNVLHNLRIQEPVVCNQSISRCENNGKSSHAVSDERATSSEQMTLRKAPISARHIAFIKTHKTASSTVLNMLARYGIANDLTFLLPQDHTIYVGWPKPFNPAKHMRPMKHGKPDILGFHIRYSPKLPEVMPADTFYFTSIREPFSQMRSSYVYYRWYDCSGKSLSQVLNDLLKVQWLCVAPTFNPMMFDLGFPVREKSSSLEAIDAYIDMLDKQFNLIMIAEYFDESLIILRDMLGWKDEDILTFAINFRQTKSSSTHNAKAAKGVDMADNDESRSILYQKAVADMKLYQHFKRKLEKIINANKSYITQEKKKLQERRLIWMEYCVETTVPSTAIKDERFKSYGNQVSAYVLTKQGLRNQTCIDLTTAERSFVSRINAYQPYMGS